MHQGLANTLDGMHFSNVYFCNVKVGQLNLRVAVSMICQARDVSQIMQELNLLSTNYLGVKRLIPTRNRIMSFSFINKVITNLAPFYRKWF